MPRNWGTELEEEGWRVLGIKVDDEETMADIFNDLKIQDCKDSKKLQRQLRAYIVEQQLLLQQELLLQQSNGKD